MQIHWCDWLANTSTGEQAFCFGRSIQDSGDLGVPKGRPRAVTCGAVSGGKRIRLPISSRQIHFLLSVFVRFITWTEVELFDKFKYMGGEIHLC